MNEYRPNNGSADKYNTKGKLANSSYEFTLNTTSSKTTTVSDTNKMTDKYIYLDNLWE